MINHVKAKELMKCAIDEAKKSKIEDKGIHPYVGAIIANCKGEVIVTAHRGETSYGRHAEFIALSKAADLQIDLSDAELFITLEPCTARGPGKTSCTERIIDSGIKMVHIGMLDPNPQILGKGEFVLRQNNIGVERFPNDLVRELDQLNAEFISLHRETHLPSTSLYVTTQICDIMQQELSREGMDVGELPYDWDVSIIDLIQYCSSYYLESIPWDLEDLLYRIRGIAYDKKYADYTYSKDARGLLPNWKNDLTDILTHMGITHLHKYRIINVGIGNGLEGEELLEQVDDLILVDIAPHSLEKARKRFPKAKAFVSSAEYLGPIRSSSQDIYMSLRTYQSSYLDIMNSVREAYRVLKPGGLFVVSVANAFAINGDRLMYGLVIPNTSFVDQDRPFVVSEKIRRYLTAMKFQNVGIRSGQTEIFIYGQRST